MKISDGACAPPEANSFRRLKGILENPMFRDQLLDRSAQSEGVSEKLDRLLDLEFEAMPTQKQERIRRLASIVAAKCLQA